MVGVRLPTGPRRPETRSSPLMGVGSASEPHPSLWSWPPTPWIGLRSRGSRTTSTTSPKPPGRSDDTCFSRNCAMRAGLCSLLRCHSISRDWWQSSSATASRDPWPRVVTTPRLTALSKKLMKQAVGADGKITDVVTFRDGLMIGLLALRPVRRRAFSLIRVRAHLCQLGGEWRMIFEGSETKSGRPFAASVPEWIVPFLERYLREIRPMFLGANHHDGLWASTKGRPLTDKAIYSIITKRTSDAFGQPVNPHLFRDLRRHDYRASGFRSHRDRARPPRPRFTCYYTCSLY